MPIVFLALSIALVPMYVFGVFVQIAIERTREKERSAKKLALFWLYLIRRRVVIVGLIILGTLFIIH